MRVPEDATVQRACRVRFAAAGASLEIFKDFPLTPIIFLIVKGCSLRSCAEEPSFANRAETHCTSTKQLVLTERATAPEWPCIL